MTVRTDTCIRFADSVATAPVSKLGLQGRQACATAAPAVVPFLVRLFTFTELRDWLTAAGFTDVNGYDPRIKSWLGEPVLAR